MIMTRFSFSSSQDGKPDGTTPDLLKGKYDKSKGYFTVRPFIFLSSLEQLHP